MPTNLEHLVERKTKLVCRLNTEPTLLYSPYLSEKTGLEVSILDYSQTSTGTHKLQKAVKSVQEAKEKGQGIFLFINPVVDKRNDSDGSGIDALELASAVHYPESQTVSVVHSENPYIKSEPINKKFPDKKQRIILGINLNDFWSKEKLENYFRNIIKGKEKFNHGQVKKVRNILEEKSLDIDSCVDLTNIDDCTCYNYSDNLVKRLKDFDYLVGSAGTGERALGQIDSIKTGKLKHIIVIPNGHPLDPFHRYEASESERVQTRFKVNGHYKILEEAAGRDDVIFKSVGLFGGKKAKEMFVDRIAEHGLNINSSPDGAIGFTILRAKDNPEYNHYFNEQGLRIFNIHQASETGFNYIYNQVIPYGSKVCIVNTGCSCNTLLKQLIARGIVKSKKQRAPHPLRCGL